MQIKEKENRKNEKNCNTFTQLRTFICGAVGLTACGGEKNITVVARTQGSGTREAFDKVVTDGNGNYLEMKINGDKHFFTTDKADIQEKTGPVMSKVASDKNAIGYISLGSVNDTIKVIKVNGVAPSAETVLDGSYAIQRPFVIMTSSKVQLTDLAADFLLYLKSENSKQHADEAGCIYLSDPSMRANEGEPAIPVVEYEVKSSLPSGGKIKISGSTSMQLFIENAMSEYAALYGRKVESIFENLDLKGSSVGKKDVHDDTNGNVIGLSSASVKEDGINSFNVCLDAVAVIVNKSNDKVNDLTLAQLYDIYTGKITKFSEIVG